MKPKLEAISMLHCLAICHAIYKKHVTFHSLPQEYEQLKLF